MPDQPQGPDPIAALDQALASVPNLVKLVGSYFTMLLAVGFTREEALQMTLSFQVLLWSSTQQPSD